MQTVDLIIAASWVIPVIPRDQVLEDHSVVINAGTITDIVPTAIVDDHYTSHHKIERLGHALIPGLINTHTHAAMSLMRGLADDLPLMTWLNEHIWPAEGKWVNSEFIRDGANLAIAEMLRGGTTCFNDMYFFPDQVGHCVDATGIRACMGLIVIDFPTVWAANADEYIHKGLEIYDQFKGHSLIKTAFAPHGPYTVSDAPLEKVSMYAEELDIPIHIHLHETRDEITHGLETHAMRPMQRLQQLGLLSPRMLAVHMTHIEPDEIELYASSGGHVIHCPESNLKLGSGFCPVDQLQKLGVNVALGTDGAASNNDLDMFGEMRSAALVAKGINENPSLLNATTALEMATINGARALGMEKICGSIEVGKAADLVAVNLDTLETRPMYHPISQLVYATGRHQVNDVWVAGQHLLNQRKLTRMDEAEILASAKSWQQKLTENS